MNRMASTPDALEKALYAVVSVLRTVTTDVHQRDFILGKLEWLLRGTDDAETWNIRAK